MRLSYLISKSNLSSNSSQIKQDVNVKATPEQIVSINNGFIDELDSILNNIGYNPDGTQFLNLQYKEVITQSILETKRNYCIEEDTEIFRINLYERLLSILSGLDQNSIHLKTIFKLKMNIDDSFTQVEFGFIANELQRLKLSVDVNKNIGIKNIQTLNTYNDSQKPTYEERRREIEGLLKEIYRDDGGNIVSSTYRSLGGANGVSGLINTLLIQEGYEIPIRKINLINSREGSLKPLEIVYVEKHKASQKPGWFSSSIKSLRSRFENKNLVYKEYKGKNVSKFVSQLQYYIDIAIKGEPDNNAKQIYNWFNQVIVNPSKSNSIEDLRIIQAAFVEILDIFGVNAITRADLEKASRVTEVLYNNLNQPCLKIENSNPELDTTQNGEVSYSFEEEFNLPYEDPEFEDAEFRLAEFVLNSHLNSPYDNTLLFLESTDIKEFEESLLIEIASAIKGEPDNNAKKIYNWFNQVVINASKSNSIEDLRIIQAAFVEIIDIFGVKEITRADLEKASGVAEALYETLNQPSLKIENSNPELDQGQKEFKRQMLQEISDTLVLELDEKDQNKLQSLYFRLILSKTKTEIITINNEFKTYNNFKASINLEKYLVGGEIKIQIEKSENNQTKVELNRLLILLEPATSSLKIAKIKQKFYQYLKEQEVNNEKTTKKVEVLISKIEQSISMEQNIQNKERLQTLILDLSREPIATKIKEVAGRYKRYLELYQENLEIGKLRLTLQATNLFETLQRYEILKSIYSEVLMSLMEKIKSATSNPELVSIKIEIYNLNLEIINSEILQRNNSNTLQTTLNFNH